MKIVQSYFKHRLTFVAITVALVFQLVFSVIWITGYQKVNDNLNKMKIGILNEDHKMGANISQELQGSLPFTFVQIKNLNTAKKQLENREVGLVIHIPAEFGKHFMQAQGEKPALHYLTNESNAVLVKSMMQSVTQQVTVQLNRQISSKELTELFQQQVPPSQVKAKVDRLLTPIATQTEVMNSVTSYAKQMIPMMLVLSSFVGGMLMAVNLDQVRQIVNQEHGKWPAFFTVLWIEVVAVFLVTAVGSGLVFILGEETIYPFWEGWLFQSLMMITFVFVAQTSILILGEVGMILNTVLLSLQLVTSGAMIPRDVLPVFYLQLGNYLPATYGVEGIMNLYMGGPSSMRAITILLIFATTAILLQIIRITIHKEADKTVNQQTSMVES